MTAAACIVSFIDKNNLRIVILLYLQIDLTTTAIYFNNHSTIGKVVLSDQFREASLHKLTDCWFLITSCY
jgi:hypothetical protein